MMGLVIRRLIAFVLDWVVLFVVLVAPQGIIAMVWKGWPLNDVRNGFLAWGWVVLTVSIPSWFYFTLSDSSPRGATVGKRVLHLSTRSTEGSALPRFQALRRTAVKLLPWELTHIMIFVPKPFGETLTPFKIVMIVIVNVLMLIWLVAPFRDRWGRALHDRVADSMVIYDR